MSWPKSRALLAAFGRGLARLRPSPPRSRREPPAALVAPPKAVPVPVVGAPWPGFSTFVVASGAGVREPSEGQALVVPVKAPPPAPGYRA
eukprot:15448032-Alexandrium_andersonii.AAC.1